MPCFLDTTHFLTKHQNKWIKVSSVLLDHPVLLVCVDIYDIITLVIVSNNAWSEVHRYSLIHLIKEKNYCDEVGDNVYIVHHFTWLHKTHGVCNVVHTTPSFLSWLTARPIGSEYTFSKGKWYWYKLQTRF